MISISILISHSLSISPWISPRQLWLSVSGLPACLYTRPPLPECVPHPLAGEAGQAVLSGTRYPQNMPQNTENTSRTRRPAASGQNAHGTSRVICRGAAIHPQTLARKESNTTYTTGITASIHSFCRVASSCLLQLRKILRQHLYFQGQRRLTRLCLDSQALPGQAEAASTACLHCR